MKWDKPTSKSVSKNFELVLLVRDTNGTPTGKTKSYSSDVASDVFNFLVRNTTKAKPTGSQNKSKPAKTDKQIVEAIVEVENYVKILRKSKKLDDE